MQFVDIVKAFQRVFDRCDRSVATPRTFGGQFQISSRRKDIRTSTRLDSTRLDPRTVISTFDIENDFPISLTYNSITDDEENWKNPISQSTEVKNCKPF